MQSTHHGFLTEGNFQITEGISRIRDRLPPGSATPGKAFATRIELRLCQNAKISTSICANMKLHAHLQPVTQITERREVTDHARDPQPPALSRRAALTTVTGPAAGGASDTA
ncbi:hypothetical protein OOK36_08265 [Streptomyces sp. NBC_00365]|uniref:hypothetical protein n=1 Tax=Streptomyces sp. NBC_00365 TaxID=2975726 RepID=UPI0022523765|nr:hypothetical protein [Streptomyces sp. NBC_00365]MCX5088890.1 hypothetical protein [Streptomyces sp. NBC_00365]